MTVYSLKEFLGKRLIVADSLVIVYIAIYIYLTRRIYIYDTPVLQRVHSRKPSYLHIYYFVYDENSSEDVDCVINCPVLSLSVCFHAQVRSNNGVELQRIVSNKFSSLYSISIECNY